jgi:hypothetical protein
VRELLALLNDAGHTDFRDAHGPMEFTHRQTAGKFTRDEAAALIAQLRAMRSKGLPSPLSQRRGFPRKSTYCATCLPSRSLLNSGVAVGLSPSP